MYEIRDPRFASLIIPHAKLEKLWTGGRWVEGPVYVPAAKSVLWSDIPNDRLLRFDETDGAVSVFESPCGYQNGHTLDAMGRVLACNHGSRCVSRLEPDGQWRVLADRIDGKRLNSPNDVVVKSDGSIWFTDPSYGIDSDYEGHAIPSEIGSSQVYRIDPDGAGISAVICDMLQPNGLAFSPDETLLYVADTGRTHKADHPVEIARYRVTPGGVSRIGVFAAWEGGLFDGFRVDCHGNLWTSCGTAVHVYAPDGVLIGRIPMPETVSNLCFGGSKKNRLFITAQTSLYALFVNSNSAI